MIDVHCHLADNKFNEDLDDVISHAHNSGVEKMITVAEFESQFEKSMEISRKYPKIVYPGIGIHPIQKRNKSAQLRHLMKLEEFFVENEKDIICVGECGLDHTFGQFKLKTEDLEIQEQVFQRQIDLAKHFGKPINVHSRSAARRTIEVLMECHVAPDTVVLHAFDGTLDDLKLGLDAGFSFSIPPSFARSEMSEKLIESLPMDRILLETDSPALGPEKGVRNVPSNLKMSADLISEIKKLPIDEIIRITGENANRIFGFW